MDGRLPCAHAQSFQSSLQRGDAPLQHGSGRVADPTVAKSFDFEIKKRCSMVGAIECICDGLIDWNGYRLRRGIDVIAAVNRDRLASHVFTSAPKLCDPAHLADHPLDVRLGCPETCNARAQNRGAVA